MKKLNKVVLICLILLIGIGGACSAEEKHIFDVNEEHGEDGFGCINCDLYCKEYENANYVYKEKDGDISLKKCLRFCANVAHDHGNWRNSKDHVDDGNGKCKDCGYPCLKGHSDDGNGKCKNCGYLCLRKHVFDVNEEHGENGFGCINCDLYCKEYENANYVYKEKDGDISLKKCLRFCANVAHDHGVWRYTKDHVDDGNGKCKDCGYPCLKGHSDDGNGKCKNCGYLCLRKHVFDVNKEDGENGFSCINCDLYCKEYENANYVYKEKDGDISLKKCLRFCANVAHDHGDWRNSKDHVDDGNGKCKDCGYPCMINHGEADSQGNCKKCGMQIEIKVTSAKENGKLVITMVYGDFKLDTVESIAIDVDNNNILWSNNLKLVEKKNDEKIVNLMGNELKIMDEKIILTIKQGTTLGNHLIGKDNKINIIVDNTTQNIKGTAVIKGDFGPVPTITGFTDVEDTRWSMKSIDYVVKKEIMDGVGNNLFKPTGELTRQELAVILSRIVKERKTTIDNQIISYTDIDKCEDLAVDAVKLVGKYITTSTEFEPTKIVTKADMVVSLVKIFEMDKSITVSKETKAKIKEIKEKENLTNITTELEKALAIVLQYGMVGGDENGKINLNNNATREQLAHIIYSMYKQEVVRIECSRTNCSGYIVEKWESDQVYHRRKCITGHDVDQAKHEYNNYGKCIVCDYVKTPYCTVCYSDTKTEWIAKETMHILICTKDKTHVMRIEGHKLDRNSKCEVCGYTDTKEYPITFVDFTDQTHWAWVNVGHMVELGIVKGSPNPLNDEQKVLNPNETITAEGVIALLARVLGYDGVDRIAEGTVYKPIVSSWSEGEWKFLMKYLTDNGRDAKKEMQVLLSNNGESGTDEEIKANYGKAISRERVAHLLGRFIKSNYRQEQLAKEFVDWNLVNTSYRETIRRLSAYDIFRGRLNDGILYACPVEPITRVEAITLIDRFDTVKELGITYDK